MDKPELWKIIRLNKEQDDFDAFGVVDPQGRVTDGFTSHASALMHALDCANAELAEARRHAKVLRDVYVYLHHTDAGGSRRLWKEVAEALAYVEKLP